MPFFDLEPYIPFDVFATLAIVIPCAIAAWATDRAHRNTDKD